MSLDKWPPTFQHQEPVYGRQFFQGWRWGDSSSDNVRESTWSFTHFPQFSSYFVARCLTGQSEAWGLVTHCLKWYFSTKFTIFDSKNIWYYVLTENMEFWDIHETWELGSKQNKPKNLNFCAMLMFLCGKILLTYKKVSKETIPGFFFFFLKWTARIEKSFIIRSFSGSFNSASKCLYILRICRVSGYF